MTNNFPGWRSYRRSFSTTCCGRWPTAGTEIYHSHRLQVGYSGQTLWDTLVELSEARSEDSIIWIVKGMKRQFASNPVDRVAGLCALLHRYRRVPINNPRQFCLSLGTNTLQWGFVHDLMAIVPGPKHWFPSWTQIEHYLQIWQTESESLDLRRKNLANGRRVCRYSLFGILLNPVLQITLVSISVGCCVCRICNSTNPTANEYLITRDDQSLMLEYITSKAGLVEVKQLFTDRIDESQEYILLYFIQFSKLDSPDKGDLHSLQLQVPEHVREDRQQPRTRCSIRAALTALGCNCLLCYLQPERIVDIAVPVPAAAPRLPR